MSNSFPLQLYDLHIGNVGESSNTEDGCGKEGLLVIGPDGSLTDPSPNSTCVGNLVDDTKKCTCKPGRFGRDCDQSKWATAMMMMMMMIVGVLCLLSRFFLG